MVYKTRFIWSKSDFQRGVLSLVRCDTDGIPPEVSFANLWAQKIRREQRHASLTVNVKNTLKLRKQAYLYMDVGRWLGGGQYFGVVCGGEACVCEYSPDESSPGRVKRDIPAGGLLDQFLNSGGIETKHGSIIPPPYKGDPHHLYVIIPDVHLPAAVSPKDTEKVLRWNVYQKILQVENWGSIPEPNYGQKRDFFGSLQSADALARFLTKIAKFSSEIGSQLPRAQVTLVQIGDMYELWSDRPIDFQQSRRSEVVLTEPAGDTARTIGEWISCTHFLHQEIFDAFDKCKAELSECVFLHGNHDSYLSVPAVVQAANQRQAALRSLAERAFGSEQVGGGRWESHFKTTKIPSRVRDFHAPEGIFFEHGQRVDRFNRDGETSGPETTNAAVSIESLKAGDSTRRETFVTGASAAYLIRKCDFGLYVMGHTHDPQIKLVEISHCTDDSIPVELPPIDAAWDSAAANLVDSAYLADHAQAGR